MPTIRIGNASVGLIGLEAAMEAVRNRAGNDENAAAELLFALLAPKN